MCTCVNVSRRTETARTPLHILVKPPYKLVETWHRHFGTIVKTCQICLLPYYNRSTTLSQTFDPGLVQVTAWCQTGAKQDFTWTNDDPAPWTIYLPQCVHPPSICRFWDMSSTLWKLFSINQLHLKILFAKWQPSCSGLNMWSQVNAVTMSQSIWINEKYFCILFYHSCHVAVVAMLNNSIIYFLNLQPQVHCQPFYVMLSISYEHIWPEIFFCFVNQMCANLVARLKYFLINR